MYIYTLLYTDGDQGKGFDYENDFFFEEEFNTTSDERTYSDDSDMFKMGSRANSLGMNIYLSLFIYM
jgi:hypothetical protein